MLVSIPEFIGHKSGTIPGQGASPSQGEHTHRLMPTANLAYPLHLTCMSLDCGRKPKYAKETHTNTGRTWT